MTARYRSDSVPIMGFLNFACPADLSALSVYPKQARARNWGFPHTQWNWANSQKECWHRSTLTPILVLNSLHDWYQEYPWTSYNTMYQNHVHGNAEAQEMQPGTWHGKSFYTGQKRTWTAFYASSDFHQKATGQGIKTVPLSGNRKSKTLLVKFRL